jgi:hypothetical protein
MKQPREKWQSRRFNELLCRAARCMSDRETADWLNRIRCQQTGVIPTTVRNRIERDGMNLAAVISAKADAAIAALDFDCSDALLREDSASEDDESFFCDRETVAAAAKKLGIDRFNVADYEAPDRTANISVDDVCVKAQKPNRPMPDGTEKKKREDNTVIHFQTDEGKYLLNGYGLAATLRLLLGFMAYNDILFNRKLVFFTDGANTIHSEVERMFRFTRNGMSRTFWFFPMLVALLIVFCKENFVTEHFETAPAVHYPFNQLEFIDASFGKTVVVFESHSIFYRVQICRNAIDETGDFANFVRCGVRDP